MLRTMYILKAQRGFFVFPSICKSKTWSVVFFQHPRKGLHSGEDLPILIGPHGLPGRFGPEDPGFGSYRGEDGSPASSPPPMCLWGDLSIADHDAKLVEEHTGPVLPGVCGVRIRHDGDPGANLLLLSFYGRFLARLHRGHDHGTGLLRAFELRE